MFCRGTYKRVPCAIKVIFSSDLTAEDVNKAVVEATILSSVRSPNIVEIYGISVSPPNVCIILEICSMGSLSDVLRMKTISLRDVDRMFLAMGCCNGLLALHSFDENIVHRDIKSMNFLVDSQLNAKLADFELGRNESLSLKAKNPDETEMFLLNWMPPEYMLSDTYTKASDIYALALVLWEIISEDYPFKGLDSVSIRNEVTKGRRPAVPMCIPTYKELIERGWAMEPNSRPSAKEMKDEVEKIWKHSCFYGAIIEKDHVELCSSFCTSLNSFLDSSDGKKFLAHSASSRKTMDSASMASTGPEISLSPLYHVPDSVSYDLKNISEQLSQLEFQFSNAFKCSHLTESIEEIIIVVSFRAPHIILYCTPTVENLFGNVSNQIFGTTFEKYVLPSDGNVIVATESYRSSFFSTAPTKHFLGDFYQKMTTSGHAHTIVDILHIHGGIASCSVHSFPVYSSAAVNRDSTDLTSNSDRDIIMFYGLLLSPLTMIELSLN